MIERNNELAERLAVLIEVAAVLPINASLKLRALSTQSSLNLFTAHVGTLPSVSSTVTVEDAAGTALTPPVPVIRPSTAKLGRTVARGRARIFYDHIYDMSEVLERRTLSEVWGGETGHVGEHVYREHTTRLVVQFGHGIGDMSPDAEDRIFVRILWTDAACAVRNHHVRLPFRLRDGVVMDAVSEVEDAREAELWREHRGVGEVHSTYHTLKVAALNALADGRTTVELHDWHIGLEIVARSQGLRDVALLAYGEQTHSPHSMVRHFSNAERTEFAATRFSLSAGTAPALNPVDVQAGVRSAVREWLDANGADIAEMIARTVGEATIETPAPPSEHRVEKVAHAVHTKLTQRGPLTESGIKRLCGAEQKPYLRAALRHLEDTGRAEYNGRTWSTKTAPPATYPFAVSAQTPSPVAPPNPASATPVLSAPEIQDAVRESVEQRRISDAAKRKQDLEAEIRAAVQREPNATLNNIVSEVGYEYTTEEVQEVLNDLVLRKRIAAVQEGSQIRYHPAPRRSSYTTSASGKDN